MRKSKKVTVAQYMVHGEDIYKWHLEFYGNNNYREFNSGTIPIAINGPLRIIIEDLSVDHKEKE